MSNATVSPVPAPSSPNPTNGRSGAKLKLNPSAPVPPPTRTLNDATKLTGATPASRSLVIMNEPVPQAVVVSLKQPLLVKPPAKSLVALPKTVVPPGRPELKSAEKLPADSEACDTSQQITPAMRVVGLRENFF